MYITPSSSASSEDAFDDAFDDAFEDALGDAFEDALGDAFDDAFDDVFDDAFDDAFEDAFEDAFDDDLDEFFLIFSRHFGFIFCGPFFFAQHGRHDLSLTTGCKYVYCFVFGSRRYRCSKSTTVPGVPSLALHFVLVIFPFSLFISSGRKLTFWSIHQYKGHM